SAGPIGGAGVAAPASIWSLMRPATFFLGGITGPYVIQIFATWLNDSTTGVSRPKIDTKTLSFWVSGLISEIVAGRVSNGPSITVTDSPTSKSTSVIAGASASAGLSSSSKVGLSIRTTSSIVRGTGWWVCPTNPVTPGV